jgi:hypothetical protein
MRTFALYGIAAAAISMMVSSPVWAWSSEQAVPQGTDGVNLNDPLFSEDKLKALQDKVNGGGTSSTSGFYVYGGVSQPSDNANGFQSNSGTGPTPFGFSPIPGFRGR